MVGATFTLGGLLIGFVSLFFAAFARGEADGSNTDEQFAAWLAACALPLLLGLLAAAWAVRYGIGRARLRAVLVLSGIAILLLFAWTPNTLDCVQRERETPWRCLVDPF